MNYRHLYHAGNFADVMKHNILLCLLNALLSKDKPLCYIDTHAGLGCYDLMSETAQKQAEYQAGVTKLFGLKEVPAVIKQYLDCINELNSQILRYYPGSPYFVKHWLRPQDRIVLCELHPHDVHELKQCFSKYSQAAIHHIDGYQGLKAFLPPKEKRGLILIDPPFEKTNEFQQIATSLAAALTRFAHGVYAVWYPIKDQRPVEQFKCNLQKLAVNNVLLAEFAVNEIHSRLPLSGCGMAIINTPWQADTTIKELLAWLWSVLTHEQRGFHRVEWLVPPQ